MNLDQLTDNVAAVARISSSAARKAVMQVIEEIENQENRKIDLASIEKEDAQEIVDIVRKRRRAGKLGQAELAAITEQLAALERAKEQVQVEFENRDARIREAHMAGAKVKDIMDASGLSRESINRIMREL